MNASDFFVGRALKDEWAVIEEHAGFVVADGWLGEFRSRCNAALQANLSVIDRAADAGMEVPRSKSAPDVYLAAARALGIKPVDALVVEDSVAGVTAGVCAGATVFGFAPESPTHTTPEVFVRGYSDLYQ